MPVRSPAERAALLGSVEGLVITVVAERTPRRGADFDDLCQHARMAVWQATERFDPARCAWPGYAARVIRGAVRACQADAAERWARLPTEGLYAGCNDADEPAADDPGEDDDHSPAVADFRQAMLRTGHASALAALTPKVRRLGELAAVEGLNPGQIAARLGHPVKSVRRNLQVAVGQLARAGKVPAGLAEAAGLEPDTLAGWIPRAVPCAADRQARRELVAEAAGVPAAVLAGLLGCSVKQVQADRRAVRKELAAGRRLS